MFGCLRSSIVSKERHRESLGVVQDKECNILATSFFSKEELQIASESFADVWNLKIKVGEDPASLKHTLTKCLTSSLNIPLLDIPR